MISSREYFAPQYVHPLPYPTSVVESVTFFRYAKVGPYEWSDMFEWVPDRIYLVAGINDYSESRSQHLFP